MGYSSKTVVECVDRVRGGETIAEVADSTGISDSAICFWCRRAGVKSNRTHRRFSDEEVERFVEMWGMGESYDDMSLELGRTPSALAAYVRRHRELFPSRRRHGLRYDKARVEELEKEVERLKSLLRESGIEDVDA